MSWRLTLIAVTMCSLQYLICTSEAIRNCIGQLTTTTLVVKKGSVMANQTGGTKKEDRRISIVDIFAMEYARDLL